MNRTEKMLRLVVDDPSIKNMELAAQLLNDIDSSETIEFEVSDEDFLTYAKLAHSRDMTFNELLVEAVTNMIDKLKKEEAVPIENIREVAPWAHRDATELPKADELGHRTRYSDASSFDEVCVLCGATDRTGTKALEEPCPRPFP